VGCFRIFRYEVRRSRDGIIPDINEAVESPQRLTDDPDVAQRVLGLAPHMPTPVWGRDELAAGEMWNSNSIISWLIARSGLDVESIHSSAGGRALQVGVQGLSWRAAKRCRPVPSAASPRQEKAIVGTAVGSH